ncbi:MAG: peptidoglycan DD-metalloendopeptidase family protein [Oscillospiraceae bacterium]|nr:peptidoglycan DD-metalloendopeptidase family protein [Oscillospiraceae bacterium]
MKNKTLKSVVSLTLMLLMIFGIATIDGNIAAAAPTLDEINRLKEEAAEIAAEKEEIEKNIENTETEIFKILAKKNAMDEQIALTIKEIENIEEQIALYEQLIEEKEIELQAAQEREDKQLALYRERVRVMEESGNITYLAVIFEAASFSDLLARLDFVFEVMNYDEKLYHDYIDAKEATQRAKEDLEATKKELEATKRELEAKKAELEKRREEANNYIKELESTLEGYEALYAEADAAEAEAWAEVDRMIAEYEAEKKRLEEERKRREEEEKKKQEEENKNNNENSGENSGETNDPENEDDTGNEEEEDNNDDGATVHGYFIWPAPASYIVTSRYGMREHPVYGGQRFHYGIDIGASRGTNIIAADGGTIISAYKHDSYGWFAMIDHGNGYITLYAHMDALYVSQGQVVEQGTVLGPCGDTGTATGPHLHFEVRYNGEFQNPLGYLSGYSYQIWE